MHVPSSWLKPYCSVLGIVGLVGCRPKVSPKLDSPDSLSRQSGTSYVEGLRQSLWRKALPFTFRLEVHAGQAYLHEVHRGTGWLYRSGHVFTCRHLLPEKKGPVEIKAWDYEGNSYTMEVVWRDSTADVALLYNASLAREGLQLYPGEAVPVGWSVYSVGAPWGLSGTLYEGFVAGPLRWLGLEGAQTQPFLQLALTVQPGSSGSPVLNAEGLVVGMVSDMATRSGTYEGLALAIPHTTLEEVWERYCRFAGHDAQRHHTLCQ